MMTWTFEAIKDCVVKSQDKIHDNGWFFPGDVIPHGDRFKRACVKYYKQGLLERRGDSGDRWGFMYKLKESK